MIQKAKSLVASIAFMGALATAQAQTPTYKQTFVGIPADNQCEITLTGTPGRNIITLQGSISGSQLPETVSRDLSDAKATKVYTSEFTAKSPTDIVIEGQAKFTADMICVKQVGENTLGTFFGQIYTIPLLASQVIPAQEFPAMKFTTFSQSPANVFNNSVSSNWKLYNTESSTFVDDIVASNQTNAANPAMGFTTAQLDPIKTNTADHTAYRTISRGDTGEFALDALLTKSALENSGNGTVILQNAEGSAMPVFGYERSTSAASAFTLDLPEWRASRQHYIAHVFAPEDGQDTLTNWENAIAIQNVGTAANTIYVVPMDANGKKLDPIGVVIKLEPGQSYVGRTQDLLKNINNRDLVASMQISSQQPTQVAEMFKYDNQILSLPAASHLDAGQKLRLTQVHNVDGVTSVALLNPGERTENIVATVRGADGKARPIIGYDGTSRATTQLSVGPNAKIADSLENLLKAQSVTFADASYVDFEVVTAASTKPYNFQNPTGRIVGLAVQAAWGDGLHVEAMQLQNMDAIRMNQSLSTFNPRTGIAYDEYNSGIATLRSTVLSADHNITSVTYNPLQEGNLTKGYSATLTTKSPNRLFFAEGATVNGVTEKEFAYNSRTDPIDLGFTPVTTVNLSDATGTSSKYTTKTQMYLLPELSVQPDEKGAGTSAKLLRDDVPGMADIFYRNRAALVDPGQAKFSLTGWNTVMAYMANPSNPGRLKGWVVLDDTDKNWFLFDNVDTPTGLHYQTAFQNTPAGEAAMDELKQFASRAGPLKNNYKWVHSPNLK